MTDLAAIAAPGDQPDVAVLARQSDAAWPALTSNSGRRAPPPAIHAPDRKHLEHAGPHDPDGGGVHQAEGVLGSGCGHPQAGDVDRHTSRGGHEPEYGPSTRDISSWVPRCTTTPRSRTTISSQSRIVLSRWATIMQVQPRRRRLSATIFSTARIEGAGRLVENENAGIAGQRAADLEALPLSAAQVSPALLETGVVAAGPLRDVVVDLRVLRRLDDARPRDSVTSQSARFWRIVPWKRLMS